MVCLHAGFKCLAPPCCGPATQPGTAACAVLLQLSDFGLSQLMHGPLNGESEESGSLLSAGGTIQCG